jgi:hypothetical protein
MDTIIERILTNIFLRRSKKFRLEYRRVLKVLHRWMAKHWEEHHRTLPPCLTGKYLSLREYLESLVDLLALIPVPKFCNGLIGVSLTDSVIALASN